MKVSGVVGWSLTTAQNSPLMLFRPKMTCTLSVLFLAMKSDIVETERFAAR